MMRLTFVEANLHPVLRGRVQCLVNHERGALNPPEFTPGVGKTIPTRKGDQFVQDQAGM